MEERFAFQKVFAKNPEAYVLDAIGTLYNGWEQYKTSLEWYHKAIAIFREFQSPQAIGLRLSGGMTLERIGTVYVSLEQYENALETYQQALAVYKEFEKHTSSSLKARVLENIGMTCERLKHDLYYAHVDDCDIPQEENLDAVTVILTAEQMATLDNAGV